MKTISSKHPKPQPSGDLDASYSERPKVTILAEALPVSARSDDWVAFFVNALRQVGHVTITCQLHPVEVWNLPKLVSSYSAHRQRRIVLATVTQDEQPLCPDQSRTIWTQGILSRMPVLLALIGDMGNNELGYRVEAIGWPEHDMPRVTAVLAKACAEWRRVFG